METVNISKYQFCTRFVLCSSFHWPQFVWQRLGVPLRLGVAVFPAFPSFQAILDVKSPSEKCRQSPFEVIYLVGKI